MIIKINRLFLCIACIGIILISTQGCLQSHTYLDRVMLHPYTHRGNQLLTIPNNTSEQQYQIIMQSIKFFRYTLHIENNITMLYNETFALNGLRIPDKTVTFRNISYNHWYVFRISLEIPNITLTTSLVGARNYVEGSFITRNVSPGDKIEFKSNDFKFEDGPGNGSPGYNKIFSINPTAYMAINAGGIAVD